MKTFEPGDVALIDEILGRTLYVKALQVEIDRLTADNAELRSRVSDLEQDLRLAEDDHDADIDDLAGKLDAAHQELHDLRIRAGLGEAKRWQPVDSWSYEGRYGVAYRRVTLRDKQLSVWTDMDVTSIILPDDVCLFRLAEGQPATGKESS